MSFLIFPNKVYWLFSFPSSSFLASGIGGESPEGCRI